MFPGCADGRTLGNHYTTGKRPAVEQDQPANAEAYAVKSCFFFCLQTFLHNHLLYVEIRDERVDEKVNGFPVFTQDRNIYIYNIVRFIDNRLLLVEARHLLETFKTALDVFQSDSAILG